MLTNLKTLKIETKSGILLNPIVKEFFTEYQSIFTWPASLVLSAYLASRPIEICESKSFVELGAGTGLPSIVAALLGASHCVLTERSDGDVFNNLQDTIQLNKVEAVCSIQCLDWSRFDYQTAARFDHILGADVFYSTEDFDDVIYVVASHMAVNPAAIFWTVYQERSGHRILAPYLEKFGLKAEVIPLDSFLHIVHWEGECTFESLMSTTKAPTEQSDIETTIQSVPTFHNLELIKIFRPV